MWKTYLLLILVIIVFGGCTSPYQLTVDDYMAAAANIELGMSKAEVNEMLQPSQFRLSNTAIKQPDMYYNEDILVEILYFRSGWQDDGLTTDDEFTPYIFNNGKLVAVGWATLGGPKTQGQAIPETNFHTTTFIY